MGNKIGNGIILKMDGDSICATRLDFVDLQVSPAGFGETIEDAIDQLISAEQKV